MEMVKIGASYSNCYGRASPRQSLSQFLVPQIWGRESEFPAPDFAFGAAQEHVPLAQGMQYGRPSTIGPAGEGGPTAAINRDAPIIMTGTPRKLDLGRIFMGELGCPDVTEPVLTGKVNRVEKVIGDKAHRLPITLHRLPVPHGQSSDRVVRHRG